MFARFFITQGDSNLTFVIFKQCLKCSHNAGALRKNINYYEDCDKIAKLAMPILCCSHTVLSGCNALLTEENGSFAIDTYRI